MIKPFGELHEDQLLNYGDRYIIFFHTPFCGTCKLARKMLDIVDATIKGVPLYSYNANFAGHILRSWKIQSVPALAYVEDGELRDVQFAFQDVNELYRRIQLFIEKGQTS